MTSINEKFGCDICEKQFLLRHSLIIHYEAKHQFKYNCNECELTFAKSSLLRLHQKTAHISTSFKCEFCNKINLRVHAKVLDIGE